MGRESFAKLLGAMLGEPDVAEQVARGDFEGIGGNDLTAEEHVLLSAAAADLGDHDAAGFSSKISFTELERVIEYQDGTDLFINQPELPRGVGLDAAFRYFKPPH